MFLSSPLKSICVIVNMLVLFLFPATVIAKADVYNGLASGEKPGLGREVSSYVGTIVSPNGTGLPNGSGSVADGKVLFQQKCMACHGTDGRRSGNQLVGGRGSLASQQPLKTVGSFWPYATTLYDYIARAMPYNQEKSLSASEVYAITAYVLNLNGILEEDARLDRASLPMVVMPNKDGFVELTPGPN